MNNSLRVDDKPGEDTRHNVRAVLRFMGDAFLAMEKSQGTGFEQCENSKLGAFLVINLCEEALREADDSESGETDGR
jgi:hypothetical protein